jgi:hypothetical protein
MTHHTDHYYSQFRSKSTKQDDIQLGELRDARTFDDRFTSVGSRSTAILRTDCQRG